MNARPEIVFVLASLVASLSVQGQELYKHQDKSGTVTYSDRPDKPDEQAIDIGPPNVTTPEATRLINQKLERQRTREALREQYQQDSVNSAEEARRAMERERIEQEHVFKRDSERAERKNERDWRNEGDTRRNEQSLPR